MLPERRRRVVSAILGDVGFAMATLATLLVTRASTTQPGEATAFFELATAGGSRSVEPLIGVFPAHVPFRMTTSRKRIDLVKTEAAAALSTASTLVTGAPHKAGLIYLLLGEWEKAIDTLPRGDASSARELSAAYYMRGRATDSLSDFAMAFQTLSAVPDSAEVTFNRALILEQLCDREAAADEWRKYLSLDGTSAWAGEARQHLTANTTPSQAQAWQNDRIRLLAAASAQPARSDLRAWVARYPLAARRLVETNLLPRWGNATLTGDRATAAQLLTSAGNIASALVKLSGDQLLRDAVEEIRGAEGAGDLAIGWSAYGEACGAIDHYDGPTALARLDCAAIAANEHRVFAAVVAAPTITARYYSDRSVDVEALVEQARARFRDRGHAYVGFFARLDWQQGVMRVAKADPGEAIRLYQRALAAYERLGETEFQAAQHINLADAYRYLGQEERSSAHLLKALDSVARRRTCGRFTRS